MRRHLLSFALALAAVGACTFPEASFVQDGDDASAPTDSGGTDRTTSSSSGGKDGSSSSSGGADAVGDRGSPGDSASDVAPDVSSSSSGSGSGSGSSSGVDMCDMDGDTYKSLQCGGNDCCDTDEHAHPNVTAFFTSPDVCQSFDYNCDGLETQEWGLFSCSVGVGCTPTPGFISGPPGCGVMQPWTSMCQYMVTTCSAGATSNVTQACN